MATDAWAMESGRRPEVRPRLGESAGWEVSSQEGSFSFNFQRLLTEEKALVGQEFPLLFGLV